MAYASKYKIPFRELHTDELWEVYIYERDFTGSETELIGTGVPLITEYRPENDNDYDWIRPSVCTIGMTSITDMQFISFFTSDQRKYKVIVYRDSVLVWTGWVVPDAYKEPYITPYYEVFISATDGLLSLKDEPWESSGTESVYEGKKSLLKGIESCLSKLDLETVHLWEAAYLYETNHDTDISPLLQTYFNCERFYDSSFDPLDCYTVLLEILKACNCQIWQSSGCWNIIPQNARKSSYVRRKFEWYLDSYYKLPDTADSSETYDPNISVDNVNYRLYDSPELTFRPAWKEFKLKQDYGYFSNLLTNKKFKKYGTWDCSKGRDGFVYLDYAETFQTDNYLEWNLGDVLKNATESEYLSIEVKFYGPEDLAIEVMVLLDGTIDYTLSSAADHYTATWQSGVHYIYTMFFSDTFLPKTSNNIPADGVLKLRIFQPHKLSGSTEVSGKKGFYLNDIKVMLSVNYPLLTDTTITTAINDKNVYTPETVEMMLGDLPYPYDQTVFGLPPASIGDSEWEFNPQSEPFEFSNQQLVYSGGLYWLDGVTYKLTSLWTVKDRDQYNRLANVIADEISVNHLDPQWIINADLYGYLDYGAIISEGDKKYMILRGSQNAYNKEWELELFEIADTEQNYLMLHPDGYIQIHGGGNIIIH
jgi:hypothetical protein